MGGQRFNLISSVVPRRARQVPVNFEHLYARVNVLNADEGDVALAANCCETRLLERGRIERLARFLRLVLDQKRFVEELKSNP